MALDLVTADEESFRPFVGETFTIKALIDVPLTLDNIRTFINPSLRDKRVIVNDVELPVRKPFALTFTGPLDRELASDSFIVSHPELGEFALFLSPFRRDHDCMLYESLFN